MEDEKSNDTMENQKGWYIIKSESEDLITLCLDDRIKKMRVEPPNEFHDIYLH